MTLDWRVSSFCLARIPRLPAPTCALAYLLTCVATESFHG